MLKTQQWLQRAETEAQSSSHYDILPTATPVPVASKDQAGELGEDDDAVAQYFKESLTGLSTRRKQALLQLLELNSKQISLATCALRVEGCNTVSPPPGLQPPGLKPVGVGDESPPARPGCQFLIGSKLRQFAPDVDLQKFEQTTEVTVSDSLWYVVFKCHGCENRLQPPIDNGGYCHEFAQLQGWRKTSKLSWLNRCYCPDCSRAWGYT